MPITIRTETADYLGQDGKRHQFTALRGKPIDDAQLNEKLAHTIELVKQTGEQSIGQMEQLKAYADSSALESAQQANMAAESAGKAAGSADAANDEAIKAKEYADAAAREHIKAHEALNELKQGIAKGDFKGEPGYTPIKGIDYFDGRNGEDGRTPVKGVDYFDGKDGKDAELTPGSIKDALGYDPASQGEYDSLQSRVKAIEDNPPAAVDPTLTQETKAAPAKTVGDMRSKMLLAQDVYEQIQILEKSDLDNVEAAISDLEDRKADKTQIPAPYDDTEIRESIGGLRENIAHQLPRPQSGIEVGKYFRVAAVDESGNPVLEAVDLPVATTQGNYGLVRVLQTDHNTGIRLTDPYGGGVSLALNAATNSRIDSKTGNLAITPTNLDRAVRAGLISNSQITDADKPAICQSIGALTDKKFELIDTLSLNYDEATEVRLYTEPDGTPYNFESIIVQVLLGRGAAVWNYGQMFFQNANSNTICRGEMSASAPSDVIRCGLVGLINIASNLRLSIQTTITSISSTVQVRTKIHNRNAAAAPISSDKPGLVLFTDDAINKVIGLKVSGNCIIQIYGVRR